MRVWRLTRARYAGEAFLGLGSRLYAGRWHTPGINMVYTSTSRSLAAMELFVHLDPAACPHDLVMLSAELPAGHGAVQRLSLDKLPQAWRTVDNPGTQAIGNAWFASGKSLALVVPSAVIPGEFNVLLNPNHPRFAAVRLYPPEAFHFDARMFRE